MEGWRKGGKEERRYLTSTPPLFLSSKRRNPNAYLTQMQLHQRDLGDGRNPGPAARNYNRRREMPDANGTGDMAMGTRADMTAALERRVPAGAVPIWELDFQAWDQASGKHVVLGHEFEALSPAAQEQAMYANAEIMLSVAEEMHYAALTGPSAYWNQGPGQLAYSCMPGDTRFRQMEILRELAPNDLLLTGITGGIIGADYSLEFCYRLVDDPEGMDQLARDLLRGALDMARRLRDCGADAVISASDMADNSGPFFNPAQMERWILPYMTQWSQAIREMGLFSILHTDGNLTRYMDAIAATGLDAMQAIDPVAGMDMRTAKDIAGTRLCLCGNIDCGLLLSGRPEDVYAATRALLTQCKADGGLVLGASNAVQPDVPLENYRAMIHAWQDYGQYATVTDGN
ncbi:MAG: uroporphyrinogen decarboxylase family protein [Armatimonadota bacterium]